VANYIVTRKSDGREVYRYAADAPIEWVGFEFASHDHVEAPAVAPPPATSPVLQWGQTEFLRRFEAAERIAIRAARKTDAVLDDFFCLLESTDVVHNNDPDTVLGMGYLVQQGHLTAARRDEILGVA